MDFDFLVETLIIDSFVIFNKSDEINRTYVDFNIKFCTFDSISRAQNKYLSLIVYMPRTVCFSSWEEAKSTPRFYIVCWFCHSTRRRYCHNYLFPLMPPSYSNSKDIYGATDKTISRCRIDEIVDLHVPHYQHTQLSFHRLGDS